MTLTDPTWPCIRSVGSDGMLVSFGPELSEPANRAALAFGAAAETQGWDGVEECATSLVSAFVRFDPLHLTHDAMHARLDALLRQQDWFDAALPKGRRMFRIPTVFGTDLAPQLEDAAAVAGLSPQDAVQSISQSRVRVQAIGFAPGQPYLGVLPEAWDIPRQQDLTPKVTEGALVVAIRQLVVFSVSAPTGWRQIGQTTAQLFRPDAADPFLLRPGDEVEFFPISREEYDNILKSDAGRGIAAEALAE